VVLPLPDGPRSSTPRPSTATQVAWIVAIAGGKVTGPPTRVNRNGKSSDNKTGYFAGTAFASSVYGVSPW